LNKIKLNKIRNWGVFMAARRRAKAKTKAKAKRRARRR
jgi:hypothetical protein